jgi:hypothetical protein
MKNWKMWLIAISIDILFSILFYIIIPEPSGLDLRVLLLFFYLSIFNAIVGILIVIFNSAKEKKRNAIPFLMITVLIYLVGLGICYL